MKFSTAHVALAMVASSAASISGAQLHAQAGAKLGVQLGQEADGCVTASGTCPEGYQFGGPDGTCSKIGSKNNTWVCGNIETGVAPDCTINGVQAPLCPTSPPTSPPNPGPSPGPSSDVCLTNTECPSGLKSVMTLGSFSVCSTSDDTKYSCSTHNDDMPKCTVTVNGVTSAMSPCPGSTFSSASTGQVSMTLLSALAVFLSFF